jgi:hypothetical protein
MPYGSSSRTSSYPFSNPSSPESPRDSSRKSCRITLAAVPKLVDPLRDLNGNGTLCRRIREPVPKCRNSLMLTRIFEPSFCDLVPPLLVLVLGDVNSRE